MEDKIGIKKRHAIILLVLLISLFVWIGVFISRNSSLKAEHDRAILIADSLLSEKLLLNKQIDDANEKLNQYIKEKNESTAMSVSLNDEIRIKTIQIEKLNKDNSSVTGLKKQLKNTQKQKEDFESKTTSLNQRIQELEATLAQLDRHLTEFKDENESLKKKLEWAKNIKARTISIQNFKVIKNKSKATGKAKKVNRISATIDLMENPVTEAGNKHVYCLIYNGNKILSDGNKRFTEKKSNREMAYSAMEDINYSNVDQRVIVNHDLDQKLAKGRYKVEIYVDGSLAGKTDFLLK